MKPTQFYYRSDSSDYEDDVIPFNIDAAMSAAYKRNEGKIMSESIRPIAVDIYSWYNSLNILVGPQGKGKLM